MLNEVAAKCKVVAQNIAAVCKSQPMFRNASLIQDGCHLITESVHQSQQRTVDSGADMIVALKFPIHKLHEA